jgi:hypothetical protein
MPAFSPNTVIHLINGPPNLVTWCVANPHKKIVSVLNLELTNETLSRSLVYFLLPFPDPASLYIMLILAA